MTDNIRLETFTPAQWIGLCMFIIMFVLIGIFIHKQKIQLLEGLRGKNGVWEVEELLPMFWAIIFLVTMFFDLLLGIYASKSLWMGIDAMGAFVLGLKGYLNTHEKK